MITSARVESPLGSWLHTEYVPPPSDPLHGVLQRVWLFNGTTASPRERVFPDGTLEIVLQLDAEYRPVTDVAGEPFPPLSIGGIRTTALTIEGPGRPVRVLGLRLRPVGAVSVLRTAAYELTDHDFDLHDVLGAEAAELAERCAEAPSDVACVADSLEWVRARIAVPSAPVAAVSRALAQIEADRGDVTIAALDALGGRSRARFAAAFRDTVGVTPKRYARIVRFRRALDLLQGSDTPLGHVAAQAGYYDQPHMNAEFRVHAQLTPREFRSGRRYPNTTSLAEQFFQDNLSASA